MKLSERTDLYAPEFFFTELENHRDEIEEKSGLPERDLSLLLNFIFKDMEVVPKEEFEHELEQASQLIEDTETDDEDFKKQREVDVWKTHELVDHLDG